jgi:hypothetical protein
MASTKTGGSERPTSDGTYSELIKQIARRNDEAQKVARKLRSEREREQLARRRKWDRA